MFTDLVARDTPGAPPAAEPGARARFLQLLATALQQGQLARLVLGQHTGADTTLERVLARPVHLRGQPHLQLVYRHRTRDITKNHTIPEALAVLAALIGPVFRNAHLFTDRQEAQFTFKEKGGRDKSLLRVGRLSPAATAEVDHADGDAPGASTAHNREKQRPLDLHQPYWQDLGLATTQGTLVPAMARKWKQINKFAEIFAAALESSALAQQDEIRVIDFGSGKAYLTFAMHEWLRRHGKTPQVTGVELRAELVELCNQAAQRHGLTGLRFDAGDVRDYPTPQVDAMIALHACDTATDFALHLGLQAGARLIVCSPCCHKELRPQFQLPAPLRPLLQHGVHLGQEAEMVTDSLRALLLDAAGYDTRVFEYVSLEHTNKNKMILAVRREPPAADDAEALAAVQVHTRTALQQVEDLKRFYGIRHHSLQAQMQASGLLHAQPAAPALPAQASPA
jgi:Methyltransferase domain